MKKWLYTLLLLSVFLNIVLVYVFVFKGETIESKDMRKAILMSERNRDFVLTEMREFLESVQKIAQGILEEKPELIIEAGEKSGGSVIAHAPQGMLRALPSGFKKMGFATHALFDEIATTTKDGYHKGKAQEQLNNLLNNCITCHRIYKIQMQEEH